ncbi:MAG: hypothetical protein IJD27_05840 [Alistipes sp.]|nr:hypothetical protein [Alistipes sp.]
MTPVKRKLLRSLLNKVQQRPLNEAVELMWESDLLNKKALEKLYIDNEIERRVRAGEVKVRAMEQLSTELGCSFEKVRSAVYSKN